MLALLYTIEQELFASPLTALEETIDRPEVLSMPGADDHALGVVEVRGRHLPAFSPAASLHVVLAEPARAGLVIESGGLPIVLLVSDVNDVIEIDPREIRTAPGTDDRDGVLLGIFHHDGKLVSVVDPAAIHAVSLGAGAVRS